MFAAFVEFDGTLATIGIEHFDHRMLFRLERLRTHFGSGKDSLGFQKWKCKSAPAWTSVGSVRWQDRKEITKITAECLPVNMNCSFFVDSAQRVLTFWGELYQRDIFELVSNLALYYRLLSRLIIFSYCWSGVWSNKTTFQGRWLCGSRWPAHYSCLCPPTKLQSK